MGEGVGGVEAGTELESREALHRVDVLRAMLASAERAGASAETMAVLRRVLAKTIQEQERLKGLGAVVGD